MLQDRATQATSIAACLPEQFIRIRFRCPLARIVVTRVRLVLRPVLRPDRGRARLPGGLAGGRTDPGTTDPRQRTARTDPDELLRQTRGDACRLCGPVREHSRLPRPEPPAPTGNRRDRRPTGRRTDRPPRGRRLRRTAVRPAAHRPGPHVPGAGHRTRRQRRGAGRAGHASTSGVRRRLARAPEHRPDAGTARRPRQGRSRGRARSSRTGRSRGGGEGDRRFAPSHHRHRPRRPRRRGRTGGRGRRAAPGASARRRRTGRRPHGRHRRTTAPSRTEAPPPRTEKEEP